MCKGHLESTDHLLLHCQLSKALQEMVFSCSSIRWVTSNSIRDYCLALDDFFSRTGNNKGVMVYLM